MLELLYLLIHSFKVDNTGRRTELTHLVCPITPYCRIDRQLCAACP